MRYFDEFTNPEVVQECDQICGQIYGYNINTINKANSKQNII